MEKLQRARQSEEAGGAYKDQVVAGTEAAGLSQRVAHFMPIGNIKG
jgi:RNA-splicing ligase RtcB